MSYGQYNILGDTAPSPSGLPPRHRIMLLFSLDFIFILSKVTFWQISLIRYVGISNHTASSCPKWEKAR